jgi:hypothetical protein
MSTASTLLVMGGGSAPPPGVWPPPPREPLPPFPQPTETQPGAPQAGCWTHDAYGTALPFTPPSTPTLDFHRGNVCGHRVPGAPYVPGGCHDGSLIFTWFLYEYSPEWQDTILASYQAAGYTHINFHRAAWMGRLDGVPGCSQQEACDQVRKAKAAGLYVIVNLAIDNGPPDQADWMNWTDALIAAGMDIGVLAWQADQRFPNPGDYCQYIDWAAPYLHARGVKVAAQYMNHSCTWYNAGDDPRTPNSCKEFGACDRFSFMAWTADKIDYVYQQFDVNAPVLDTRPHQGGMLGEVTDVLVSLAGQKLCACEYSYQSQFDQPDQILESYSDLKGLSLLTASINGRYNEGGYLGGCRLPNGEVL